MIILASFGPAVPELLLKCISDFYTYGMPALVIFLVCGAAAYRS
ncbi:hypothetical protein ACIPUD_10475 [Bradyrhizobium sp. CAR08]